MHANITYNMYTQILPPVNPSYIMPFDSAAAFLERSHVLELQSQMDEEERLFNMASDEAVDITLMMKIMEWEDKIVPWNILAIEEEAHMHCKMLAREEAADMQVNQERMQEAFYRNTMPLMLAPEVFISYNWGATRLGDEDA